MKALIISSLLFFSLRAISAEVGESRKSECIYSNQTSKRVAKVDSSSTSEDKKVIIKTMSK